MTKARRVKKDKASKPQWARPRIVLGASLAAAALALGIVAGVGYGDVSQGIFMLEGVAAAFLFLAALAVLDSIRIGVGEVLALAGIAALLFSVSPDPLTRIIGSPTCEAVDSDGSRFVASTDGLHYAGVTDFNDGRGVIIRRHPELTTDYDVVGRLLPGLCLAGFDGFCIGEAVPESTNPNGPLDQLWFSLPEDRGFVSAAVVQELAPGAIGRKPNDDCEGDQEPLEIEATSLPDEIADSATLRFEAPNAVTVGVAGYFKSADGPAEWHNVGVDQYATDGFLIRWSTEGVPRQADVRVVYTVCWAGYVPGRAFGSSTVTLAGRAQDPPMTAPTPADEEIGRAIACTPPREGGGA